MSLSFLAGYIGRLTFAQATNTLIMMNMINSGISIVAGAVIIGQGVYFGGRLIYQVVETASGMAIQKINDLWDTREITHTTVKVDDEEYELLDYDSSPEVVEINIQHLTQEMFNQLDSKKLYRFVGGNNAT